GRSDRRAGWAEPDDGLGRRGGGGRPGREGGARGDAAEARAGTAGWSIGSAGSSEPLDLGPLSPQMEARFHGTVRAKETPMAEYTGLTRMDVIKRTTGPETTNGSQWEVQLSVAPPPEWLEFFKQSGEASASAT